MADYRRENIHMKHKIINAVKEIISLAIFALIFAWIINCYFASESGHYEATDKANADGTHYVYVEE